MFFFSFFFTCIFFTVNAQVLRLFKEKISKNKQRRLQGSLREGVEQLLMVSFYWVPGVH